MHASPLYIGDFHHEKRERERERREFMRTPIIFAWDWTQLVSGCHLVTC